RASVLDATEPGRARRAAVAAGLSGRAARRVTGAGAVVVGAETHAAVARAPGAALLVVAAARGAVAAVAGEPRVTRVVRAAVVVQSAASGARARRAGSVTRSAARVGRQ